MADLTPVFWYWFALAVVLLIVEAFVPAGFFLGMAAAGAVVGVAFWLMPALTWQVQLVLFAVLSLVSVVVFRRVLKINPIDTEEPLLNRRGHQYVGRTFTLDEPIVNGQGKIRVDDSTWKIVGADCETGTRVNVTGVDGVVLEVERVP